MRYQLSNVLIRTAREQARGTSTSSGAGSIRNWSAGSGVRPSSIPSLARLVTGGLRRTASAN